MNKPIVAIVGRANVGKSTIFNRIIGKRVAIVDKMAGVTRDTNYHEAEWSGTYFLVVDTGGLVPLSPDQMEKSIMTQTDLAIKEADLIVFVLDCRTGITDIDERIAHKLYDVAEKVVVVVNKVDSERDESTLYEAMQLGLGEPIGISALNGRNFGDFLSTITAHLPTKGTADFPDKEDSIKVAIVGMPNVGKSSLVNTILGQPAVLVTEEPGTTRDAINLNFTYQNHPLTIIDTAGLRKKSKITYGVEYFSVVRSLRSIEDSDVVVLLLDANQPVVEQNKKIAEFAKTQSKDIILAVNKWDLITKDSSTPGQYVKEIQEQFQFVSYAPIVFISAKTGQRVKKLLDIILEVKAESHKRIPTSQLNQFLQTIIQRYPPRHSSRKAVKFYYCTQAEVHPPLFVFSVNNPRFISKNYKQYLHNRIREQFGFEGVSIKMRFKSHKKLSEK
ncbi:MAG: ribosome biogenesis GTPase Der [Candidatus Cloacimonadia bacterium]